MVIAAVYLDAVHSWQAGKSYIAEVNLNAHHSWQARKGYIASNRHRPCPGASKSTAQLAGRNMLCLDTGLAGVYIQGQT